jgi:hypothetical protein
MKTSLLPALFATTLLAAACGPNTSEKTAMLLVQKAKSDSIRTIEIRATKDEQAYQASLRDSLTVYNDLLTRQQKTLTLLQAAINSGDGQMTQTRTLELTNLRFAVQHSQDQISLIRRQLPR